MKIIQSRFKIITFLLLAGFVFASCSSDDDNKKNDSSSLTDQDIHHVQATLVSIIRDSGRDFPQFDQSQGRPGATTTNSYNFLDGPNNYMETTNTPGELKIGIWLDDEGNIIPSPTWQENNPNYCSNQGLSMRAPSKLLESKVFYDQDFGLSNPNQAAYGAQINLIDVETANIEESVWSDPIIDQDNNWIEDTLDDAWDDMMNRTTVKGAVGPCEGEIILSLHFSSEFKRENLDPDGGWERYDKVEGVISLSFNPDKNAYEGTGSIASVDGYFTSETGDPLYEPYQGQLKVVELVTPLLAEGGLNFPFMALSMSFNNDNTYGREWLLTHGFPDQTYGSPENNYFAVTIDDWDDADESGLILQKTYNLNDYPLPGTDYGDNNITEHTVIQIIQE